MKIPFPNVPLREIHCGTVFRLKDDPKYYIKSPDTGISGNISCTSLSDGRLYDFAADAKVQSFPLAELCLSGV